jgi:asparagine synthase (glutamine-hydrolysing)
MVPKKPDAGSEGNAVSAIVGILGFDGKPVDPAKLASMARVFERKCPHGVWTWTSGPVGLAYCHLTTSEAGGIQPQLAVGAEPELVVVMDGWLDNRGDLGAELASCAPGQGWRSDADLLLGAYRKWGRRLVEHIIGDFAFAIWDQRQGCLLLGRDHFGLRPLYYRSSNGFLYFSSGLSALSAGLDQKLRDESVFDYLAFGTLLDSDATIFQGVSRVPAATTVLVRQGKCDSRRYWEVPEQNPGPIRSTKRWVEELDGALSLSVSDRCRGQRVAVELTGGMDSTSVAALASAQARILLAQTVSGGNLDINDKEVDFASLVSKRLSVPHQVILLEHYPLFKGAVGGGLKWPFPYAGPDPQVHQDRFAAIVASGASLLVTGVGGDAVFSTAPGMPVALLKSGRWISFAMEIASWYRHFGTFRGLGIRSGLFRPSVGVTDWSPPKFAWLEKDFAARVHADQRWAEGWHIISGARGLSAQLRGPWVSGTFETYEAPDLPVVVRHPYFDIRVVNVLARAPTYALRNKLILRMVMRDRLPEAVLVRSKSPVAGDPAMARLRRRSLDVLLDRCITDITEAYFDGAKLREAIKRAGQAGDAESTWPTFHLLSPLGLATWLVDRAA